MAPDPSRCRVVLIGMMGSGKTTIGRVLATATGWPYVDNDELLRRHTGSTARELLASGREEALREAESDALLLGLELPPPVIVGVAAGTVLEPRNRERLRADATVVWLHAPVEVLLERSRNAEHRPFVDRAGTAWMASAAAEREPLYREIADLVVDTGRGSPADAAETIRAHLPECGKAQPG
jgi:shikimate kinase